MTNPPAIWSENPCPVVGMVHLKPLPGSPGFAGDLRSVLRAAKKDAESLVSGGVDGLLVENLGDAPFVRGRVSRETVACMAAIASEIRQEFSVPLGINVLRNDGQSALAIAQASGAQFIRVNVLCGACLTDQGIVQGIAAELMRDRARLDATDIQVLADICVKHSVPLANRPLSEEVVDLVQRGGADAIVVSGTSTGSPTDLQELKQVKAAAGNVPVWIGSGVNETSLESSVLVADGLIVGTGLKQGNQVHHPVDPQLVARLVKGVSEWLPQRSLANE